MDKNRLETFSDAVFAIVITLLILDIHIPHVSYSELPSALANLLPQITSYALSFAVIGLYWVGHHYYFRFIAKINNVFIWLNLFLLLLISFIPVPTALLGAYPYKTIPTLIYGFNLLILNLASLLVLYYLRRHSELTNERFSPKVSQRFLKLYMVVNGSYLVALGLAFFAPVVSFIIYILILILAIKVYAIRETE